MNEDRTFWECVYDARSDGLLRRVWRTRDLIDVLTPPAGRFSPNTVSVLPYNGSISGEGDGMGDYVKRGVEPKAWRVGRGRFRLIVDPDDDAHQQDTQRELAKMRAEKLRGQFRRTSGQVHPESPTHPQIPNKSDSPERSEKEVPTSWINEAETTNINDPNIQEMPELSTEQKALCIVRRHIRDVYGEHVEIEENRDGVDLRITANGQTVKRIEVKGTASKELAWSQLKVSSQKSHDALESGDATIYRVVDVEGKKPRIFELAYGRDFTLVPEPRWAVKQTRPKDDRYPLRGRPYRYNLPFEPMAQDDWETLE